MLKKTALAITVSMLLGGCATPQNICLPNTTVNIANSEVPTKGTGDKQYIVMPVDIAFKDSAAAKLKSTLVNQLEIQLTDSGVQTVDRTLANKLQKELKLAEQTGRFNTKGIAVPDFAILTEITKSSLSYSHNEVRYYENKDGEKKKDPASCDFTVEFAATAKVVSLPDMTLVKRIELTGNDSFSTETTNSRCPISEGQYAGLAVDAAIKSIEHNFALRELLAPSAPVLELRHCEEEGSMVKIGIGSNKNLQPDTEVLFSTSMKNSEGEVETFGIGKGQVVDIPMHGIKPNYSWVALDEETALKIMKGDEAKIVPVPCPIWDAECWLKQVI